MHASFSMFYLCFCLRIKINLISFKYFPLGILDCAVGIGISNCLFKTLEGLQFFNSVILGQTNMVMVVAASMLVILKSNEVGKLKKSTLWEEG